MNQPHLFSIQAVVCLFLFLIPTTLWSQSTNRVDSLLNILENHPNADTNRMYALEMLGSIYQDVDNVKAIPFYEQSGAIAKTLQI